MSMQRRGVILLSCAAVLAAALHVFLALRWVREDVQPPGWDTSVHLGTAMDYRQAWRDDRWLDLLRTKARPGHPRYPPLYHYTVAPLASMPEPHIAVAWLNLAYFMALVFCIAWIAYLLAGVPAAATALCVAGLSPQLLYEYREAFPDTGLALWVTLAYAFFIRSGLCARRLESVFFGLFSGFAVLTRWNAVIYLFPAAVAAFPDKDRRRNLLLAILAAAAICSPWYLFNTAQMLPQIWVSANIGHEQGLPKVWSWAGWRVYWNLLAECYSWPGLLLLSFGALLAVRKGWRRAAAPNTSSGQAWGGRWRAAAPNTSSGQAWGGRWRAAELWVGAWLAFSMLFLTLVPNKHWRYFMPAAVALPALGAAGLPAPALPAAALIAAWHSRRIRRPDPAAWPLEEILREVESRRDRDRGPASLCLLSNHRNMNSNNIGWLARHGGLGVFVGGRETDIPEWSDFVLLKTGDPGPFISEHTLRITEQALKGARAFSLIFQEARRWPLPDGSEAVLYEQRRRLPFILRPIVIRDMRIRSAALEGIRVLPSTAEKTGGYHYEISVSTIILGKLNFPVRGLRARADGARLTYAGGKVRVLGVKKLTLSSAEVRWEDLSRGLTERARLPVTVKAEDGAILLSARLGWLALEASVTVSSQESRLRVQGRRLRLAGLPLPGFGLIRWETDLAARPPNQPYDMRVGPIRITDESLRIGD